ncbi:MAG: D-glycero-beta-D-manno-heptose-7-phosphate kinase [Lentisphaerae bacterium]|nr:D-glycero-beta-D-manno-heptose-7-phosphate kinase [Lentisphaerota bacterium]
MNVKNNVAWAERIVSKFPRRKILIVGDLMLDRYIYGSVDRISPEAPVPVVRVGEEKNMPGGAANVAKNVHSLGAQAILSGVVGHDHAGRELMAVLAKCGVSTRGILALPGVKTTVKTRILADRQQVVRVDWEDQLRLSGGRLDQYCDHVSRIIRKGISGVIIEDYGKGVIAQDVVDAVLSAGREAGVPVGLDPKDNAELQLAGISVATPNRKEAYAMARVPEKQPGADPLRDESLLGVARILMEQWEPEFLIVTLGAQGMLLVSKDGKPRHIPTQAREVFDVSGAGDTVIATTLLALAAGAGYDESAELANCAAGVVVGKIGTATCTATELLGFLGMLVRAGLQNKGRRAS